MKRKYGVVDTTFSRVDMAREAIDALLREDPDAEVIRYTVPGIKDIPVAARRLVDEGCESVITLGWVGRTSLDKYSYLALSIGLIMLQLMTSKHVLDVTVHEDEAEDEQKLYEIAVDRARKHAVNMALLVKEGGAGLSKLAGKGFRQGYANAGPIEG